MAFATTSHWQTLIDLILDLHPKTSTKLTDDDRPKPKLGVLDEFDCSPDDMTTIMSALEAMSLVYAPVIYSWPGVGKELANRLAGLTFDTISIGCTDCAGPQFVSSSSRIAPRGKEKYSMKICADVTQPHDIYARRSLISFYVFRELIALAGGTALDQYGLYTYFVLSQQDTAPMGPAAAWLPLMCLESTQLAQPALRAGTFMVWSNVTGQFGVGDKVAPTLMLNVLNPHAYFPAWRSPC
jgi:hypothetical protein